MSKKSQARRVSILKPTRLETNDDENEAKVPRKVRFSSNFVKEFVPVRDENFSGHTIWANDTYEEAIERSSTSNASLQLHDKANVLPHKVQGNIAQEKVKNIFFPDFIKPPGGTNPIGDVPKNPVKVALSNFVSKSTEKTSKKSSGSNPQIHCQNEHLSLQAVEQDIQKSVLFAKTTTPNSSTEENNGAKRKLYFNSTTMGNDSEVFEMTEEFTSPVFLPEQINTDTVAMPEDTQKTIFFNATLEETKVGDVEIKDNLQKEHKVGNIGYEDDSDMHITRTGACLLQEGQKKNFKKPKARQTMHCVEDMDLTHSEGLTLHKAVAKARLPGAVVQEATGLMHEINKNVEMCMEEENEKCQLHLRPTIHFNVHCDDAHMDITRTAEKTGIFDGQTDNTKNSCIKPRQTIHFNINSEDGDMDLTQGVGNFCNARGGSKGVVELQTEGKLIETTLCKAHTDLNADMDMTSIIERTNIIHVYDDRTNNFIAKPHQTILFNATLEGGDMNMTEGAGNLFQGRADGCRSVVELKTEAKSRKTIYFHSHSDDADMDITRAVERTNIVDVHDDKTNKSIAAARQMIFNVNPEDMTQGVGYLIPHSENDSKKAVESITEGKLRQTILFNEHSDDADDMEMDMDITKAAGNFLDVAEISTKNTSFDRSMNENYDGKKFKIPMGESALIDPPRTGVENYETLETIANSRQTINFNTILNGADMDITQGAANFIEEKKPAAIPFDVYSYTGDMDQLCANMDFSHAHLFEQMDAIWDGVVEEEANAPASETVTWATSRRSRTTIHFDLPQEGTPKEESIAEKNAYSIGETGDKELNNVAGVLTTNSFAPHEGTDVNVTKVTKSETEGYAKETPCGSKELDADIHMQLGRTLVLEETICMPPLIPPQMPANDFDREDNVVEKDVRDWAFLEDVPVEFYSPEKSPELEDLQRQEALIFNRKRLFEDSPACVQNVSMATCQSLSKLPLQSKVDATARRAAKKIDQKDTPVRMRQMHQATFQVEDVFRDPIESAVMLDATFAEPIANGTENSPSVGDLRKKYLKQVIEEIHLPEIDSSKFRREPIKLSLGNCEDLDERLMRVEEGRQKYAQLLELVNARRKKLHEEINEQTKKVKLEIEKLEEPIDIQKIIAASMTLTDKVRQKARNHEQYRILDISEECLRVFVNVGEFELSVTMKKDCGTVVSLDVDEPILDEKTNDTIRWVHKFFHRLMNPQRMKSCIGSTFSVLSLLDYLECEMEKFGEIFIAVYHALITYTVEFKDDQLFYRHFTFWVDVEIIINLSDFNMEKATVRTIIHDGQVSLRMIEDIVAEQARDAKFPLNVLAALDEYFEGVSRRKNAQPTSCL